MAAKKRIKKKTYSEFLSWLEGVESMQETSWVPNKDQWSKIREMLNHIKPDEIEVEVEVTPRPAARVVPGTVPQHPQQSGQPVARLVERNAQQPQQPQQIQQSSLEPPKRPEQPKQPAHPQPLKVPSGMPGKENILDPGNAHKQDEYL